MKHIIIYLTLAILFNQCNKKIVPERLLNNTEILELTITKKNIITQYHISIYPNSEKYTILFNWLEKNSKNWKISPLSYSNSNFFIRTKNCDIRFYESLVVINYINIKGKGQQFVKSFNQEELSRLTMELSK